jgi:hypothetical protein
MPSVCPSSLRVLRPSGAPSPRNPLPGATFPPRCRRPGSRRSGSPETFRPRLVAGVQSRFGPPSPFLTTLTACPSPDPVASFSHSHPWGSASRCPAPFALTRGSEESCVRARGMGHGAEGSRPDVTPGARLAGSAEALPVRRGFPGPPKPPRAAFDSPPAPKCRLVAAASLRRRPPLHPPRWMVRLRLPSPSVSSVVRRRPRPEHAASGMLRP